MDNLSIFLFAIAGISTLVGAFYLMASAANSKPVRDYNAGRLSGTWTTEVKKPIHPEMRDIKEGDELLVVNFDQPQKETDPRFKLDSPELHNLGDPLQQSLRDRINELNNNDDEDDDGDVPSIVRR